METELQAYTQYFEQALLLVTQYGLKIMFALVIFFVGKRIARGITNLAIKSMTKQNVDVELIGFFNSLLYWALFALVTIAALAQLGIQTASFVALIGAVWLLV